VIRLLRSMITSMSGMNSVQNRIDSISNHIANLNTPGFKRKDALFEDLLYQAQQQPTAFRKNDRMTPPAGIQLSNGVKQGRDLLQFTQGNLNQTGNTLDFAIEGDAMFEIASSQISGDDTITTQTKYTRDGAFRLTTQPGDLENGYLVTQDGYFVRNMADDLPIKIPNNYEIRVDSDGRVFARKGMETLEVGQMKIVRVLRPQALLQTGGNMYQIDPGVNNANNQIVAPFRGNQVGLNSIKVHQGSLELSNVDLATEMSELMVMQRSFQLNSRALQTSDQMMSIATNIRG
jgi:flagellar basal-body rod protein FlgG